MSLPKPYYQDDWATIYHGRAENILVNCVYHVIVTDPPYGIALHSSRNGAFGDCAIEGDASTQARDWLLDNTSVPLILFASARIARPAAVRHTLIWDKGEHVGMGDLSLPWKPNFEEIHILGYGWIGRRQGSVLRHNAIAGTVAITQHRWHPTEKPISLMRQLLQTCPRGWVVADPFAGSGSTLVAAKSLGRRSLGIEVEERYCEIAAKRLAQAPMIFESPEPEPEHSQLALEPA